MEYKFMVIQRMAGYAPPLLNKELSPKYRSVPENGFLQRQQAVFGHVLEESMYNTIVNGIRNFVFGLAKASIYGFCKNREQKFIMSFTIKYKYAD